MLFSERFIGAVNSDPEAIAILDASSRTSYRQLLDKVQRLAQQIVLASSEPMIGVLMEKGTDYIVSILAIHLLGRTVVPLDGSYPVKRLKQMIRILDLSLCLVNQKHNHELNAMLKQETSPLLINAYGAGASSVNIRLTALDEVPAYVVFTSGTTGQPKPVMVPYRSLNTLVEWMVRESQPNGTTLLYAAQGFDVSFQEIYGTLCHGDCLLTLTETQKKDPHALIALLSSQAVTRLFLPTSMLIPFVSFGLYEAQPLAELTQIIVAGEQLKITPAVRQWFSAHPNCRLINHYGPSETHVVMVHQLDDEPQVWPDLPPIGHVTPASTAYLLDNCLEPVAQGHLGQLYISGRSLALGYYDMPTETAEKFVTHPQTQERMYNTGDICVLNEQGFYEYRGRRDRQHKVRGYRIELKEIEAAVTSSGLVDDCLLVARQSELTTLLILYFTALAPDQDISLRLHSHLAARFPAYMLPSFYSRISAIPLTPNGKVDTEKLPQVGGLRPQRLPRYVAPRSERESMVCALAASCFGLDRVGACDNFMDAGANSITLISLLAELRYVLGHDFRQTDLFEYPTPRLLCASYQHLQDAQTPISPTVPVHQKTRRAVAIQRSQKRKRG
jgi:amino acid adenylation domain-containing protein